MADKLDANPPAVAVLLSSVSIALLPAKHEPVLADVNEVTAPDRVCPMLVSDHLMFC